ncbi:hypothetical protein PIB30_018666 [Stylosanthes scabra]|uniref:Uncharacterized protein n=1 Tax=Stylosanthes scabra TaxID=79078 RepID=A0ABU6V7U8_9FABA|nr:hypothetical protein [Stylosanthes scabra]
MGDLLQLKHMEKLPPLGYSIKKGKRSEDVQHEGNDFFTSNHVHPYCLKQREEGRLSPSFIVSSSPVAISSSQVVVPSSLNDSTVTHESMVFKIRLLHCDISVRRTRPDLRRRQPRHRLLQSANHHRSLQ